MAEANNFQYQDSSDSGLWKMLISISDDEMIVIMKPTEEGLGKSQLMFRKPLTGSDSDKLQQIENSIYEHPRMMEDYATEVILTTGKAVWVPTDYVEDEEKEEKYLCAVYRADPADITSNSNEEESCIFSFLPGLLSFLNRTLPGCRVYSHQFLLNRELHGKNSGAPRVYVVIRRGRFDLIAYREGQLVSVSTHEWRAETDMAYYVYLLADAYDIDMEKMEVIVAGLKEEKKELEKILKEMTPNVYRLKEPSAYDDMKIPLAMAFALER